MYNKGKNSSLGENSTVAIWNLVVSASRTFAALDRSEAIARHRSELALSFPAMATAKLEKAA